MTSSRKFPNNGHHTHESHEVTAMPDNPIHTFFQILGATSRTSSFLADTVGLGSHSIECF